MISHLVNCLTGTHTHTIFFMLKINFHPKKKTKNKSEFENENLKQKPEKKNSTFNSIWLFLIHHSTVVGNICVCADK